MLVMPVGTGKTNCALYVCVQCKTKTLWLAHRKNLMEQAAARALEFAPNLRVGYLYADVCDIDDKDIVFGTVQSLSLKLYDPAVVRQFGMVVLDEAHHAAAQMFVDALWQVAMPRMLAVTANSKRKDGLIDVVKHFFSSNTFEVEPLLPDGIVLNVRVHRFKARSSVLDDDMCDSRFKAKQRKLLEQTMTRFLCSEAEAVQKMQEGEQTDEASEGNFSALCSALTRIASRNALLCAAIKQALVTPDAKAIGDISLDELRDYEFAALHDRERANVAVSFVPHAAVAAAPRTSSSSSSTAPCASATTVVPFAVQQRKIAAIDTLSADEMRGSMQQCERQVIVLCKHVAHVKALQARLVRSGVPKCMIGMFFGEIAQEERESALKRRVVLCTYALAEEGLDVPTANTLIEAGPCGDSANQVIGRILRDKMTPAIQPTIVTVVDDWSGLAMGMFGQRERQYRRYKCALKTFAIAADDARSNEPGVVKGTGFVASVAGAAEKKKRAPRKTSVAKLSVGEKRERKTERAQVKKAKRAAFVTEMAVSAPECETDATLDQVANDAGNDAANDAVDNVCAEHDAPQSN